MRRHWSLRITALAVSALLALAVAAPAEELGEMDLYDPAIYAGEAPVERPPEAEQDGLPEEMTWTEAEPGEDGPGAEPVDGEGGAEPPAEAEKAPASEGGGGAEPVEPPTVSATDTVGLTEAGASVAAPAAGPELCLGVGEKFALEGAFGYLSDRPDVASVDAETGVVTAVSVGRAVVTATRTNGSAASCTVTVMNAPDALSFDAAGLKLGVGEKRALPARLPENAAARQIRYVSSQKSVVAVDGEGNLTAKKKGTAVITAMAFNGAKAVCKVQVLKAPSKVTLSRKKWVLNLNDTAALAVKLPKQSASAILWKSSDEKVVAVDGAGGLRAVGAGTATVTAWTFNRKKAACKVAVLEGAAPTKLSLGAETLTLGRNEKLQLVPRLGDGEAALYTYASSRKSVVAVSGKGVITAKKKGTARIAVRTHNGLQATVKVVVRKAPDKVTLSPKTLSLQVGGTGRLSAALPAGTASTIRWISSDEDVVQVDDTGCVTALKAGTATVCASTFNNRTAGCRVTVTAAATEDDDNAPRPTGSAAKMAARLRESGALGGKRVAIAGVVELLINAGFEPAFAAGVGANVYAEGTYGMFESSKYITNYKKRPRYFCYLDGGEYYSGGVLTAVYLSAEEMETYTGGAEARLRFGEENYYRDRYSGRFVQDINLTDFEAFIRVLDEGKWEGKFGVGIVQWTGSRTKKLVAMYRKHAGEGDSITAEQVMAAENEMILYDLKGDYARVYSEWKNSNPTRNSAEAARSAGALICTKYEIPVDKNAKAVTRGNKAAEIFRIMAG